MHKVPYLGALSRVIIENYLGKKNTSYHTKLYNNIKIHLKKLNNRISFIKDIIEASLNNNITQYPQPT